MKTLLILLFSSSQLFASGEYKKNDILYVWKNATINLRAAPNSNCEVITYLSFANKLIVIDNDIKKFPFSIQEIAPVIKYDSLNENLNFRGFKIKGFWVKVKTESGEIGYFFDGYLSKMKPDFELTEIYFNQNFKELKSKKRKFNDAISDSRYENKYFYKNGSYIIELGSNYDGHSHYFIPNITLEEAYFLVLKTRPDVLELQKSSGDTETNYSYDGKQLSFSTSLESISITKITYKGLKGVEILFEAWD